ncbi:hypothetical protein [Streptosporangium sp. NPDC051022]|uniref:hypothetical protein n=1 Tax=Streptosporangium sp. NPDC051022 TaxID=3155752 RepID=UPI00341F421A
MLHSEPVGFPLSDGFLVTVAATVVASLLFAPGDTTARVAVMMIAVCVHVLREPRRSVALATAVMAWLFTTGFLVNTSAELTFGGHDLTRLGLLLLVAALACGVRRLGLLPSAPYPVLRSVPSPRDSASPVHQEPAGLTPPHPRLG